MAVEVIATIEPANNGNFPVVRAEDIEVTTNKRLKEVIKMDDIYTRQDLGLVWMKWTNNLETSSTSTVEDDAIAYSKHDLILMQRLGLNDLADSKPTYTAKTIQIIKRAKELNPNLRIFEYVHSDSGRTDFSYDGDHAHLNSDGSWEGSTADLSGCSRIYTREQFCDWFDYFKETGADGIFFDDWGYDFAKEDICYQYGWSPDDITDLNEAKNKKWTALIEDCHDRGLAVITNGWMPFGVGDWYTHMTEEDVICLESCMISSAGQTWANNHDSIYNYYTNYYLTGKCKAKTWALAYIPAGQSKDFDNKVITYVTAMGLACGVDYVSVGVGKLLERPDFLNYFAEGETKVINKVSTNIYQINVGRHQLETHRFASLTGVVTENTLDKNYFTLDGRPFNNGFTLAPMTEYETNEKIKSFQETIDGLTEDTRKNASSYWRMSIDDWQPDLKHEDYTNLMNYSNFAWTSNYPDKCTLNVVRNDDDSIDLEITYKNVGASNMSFEVFTASNIDDVKLTGQGLEYGYDKIIFDMDESSFTLPDDTPYYGSSDWAFPSFRPYFRYTMSDGEQQTISRIEGIGSDLGIETGHYCRIPEGELTACGVNIWMRYNGNSDNLLNGTVTLKNVYLIDLGEHSDEIMKKWYTNIFPTSYNVKSAINVTQTISKKRKWSVYDVTATTKDPWGWSFYKFSGEELLGLRGHTVELGCSSMVLSNGETGGRLSSGAHYDFGIGVNREDPNSVNIITTSIQQSQVWDEELLCVRTTIPEDATTVTVGFKSFGYPNNLVCTLKDVYLYDLSEDVQIRGQSSTNASLRLCRVTQEEESADPSKLRNALYITDEGSVYSYDLRGNKTDIAGAVFTGAVRAGFMGTPERFGLLLFNLLKMEGLIPVTPTDTTSITEEGDNVD